MSGEWNLKRGLKWAVGVPACLFVVIQLVPYGRGHTNPPIEQEPAWDRPQTRELAVKACYDCHSNETRWPWYSHVAPMSWFVQKHVDEARRELNFSRWNNPQPEAKEAEGEILDGRMPMAGYLWFHADSKLTPEEKKALAEGMRETVRNSPHSAVSHDAQ